MKKQQIVNWLNNHYDELEDHRQKWIIDMIQGHIKQQRLIKEEEKRKAEFEKMTFREFLKAMQREIESTKPRGQWCKAVKEDALWLLDTLEEDLDIYEEPEKPQDWPTLEALLLNGAYDYQNKEKFNQSFKNWIVYSEGGCACIYDEDIAKHYCNPTELKRYKNGLKAPDSIKGEDTWLKVQGRALYQAAQLIYQAFTTILGRNHYAIDYQRFNTLG